MQDTRVNRQQSIVQDRLKIAYSDKVNKKFKDDKSTA